MTVRKRKEMKAKFDRLINDKRIEVITDEIRLLLADIKSARTGKSILGLEEIEKQLEELQDFILVSK